LKRGRPVPDLPPVATTLAYRGDSGQIALALPDGNLRLLDLPAGKLARQWNAGGPAAALAFDPVRAQIAVALQGRSEIRICDRHTGSVVLRLPNPGQISWLDWRSDGRILAAACYDKVQVWDMTSGQLLSVLVGHESGGLAVTFNHRGDLLAS